MCDVELVAYCQAPHSASDTRGHALPPEVPHPSRRTPVGWRQEVKSAQWLVYICQGGEKASVTGNGHKVAAISFCSADSTQRRKWLEHFCLLLPVIFTQGFTTALFCICVVTSKQKGAVYSTSSETGRYFRGALLAPRIIRCGTNLVTLNIINHQLLMALGLEVNEHNRRKSTTT